MTTREEVLSFIAGLPQAVYDMPFEGDFYSTVLRHGKSKKWFGLIIKVPESFYGGGGVALNLKCPQDLSQFLCASYRGVLPAYHMNKRHWISVMLGSDVPTDEIKKLITLSYDITGGACK